MIRIVCWRDMRYYVSLWNNNISLNSDKKMKNIKKMIEKCYGFNN